MNAPRTERELVECFDSIVGKFVKAEGNVNSDRLKMFQVILAAGMFKALLSELIGDEAVEKLDPMMLRASGETLRQLRIDASKVGDVPDVNKLDEVAGDEIIRYRRLLDELAADMQRLIESHDEQVPIAIGSVPLGTRLAALGCVVIKHHFEGTAMTRMLGPIMLIVDKTHGGTKWRDDSRSSDSIKIH